MLQQTRVQAVIPYYEKFLRRFPDVESLATAPEEEVLACWSGLGYYSRARNLLSAARIILREHRGIFPRDFAAAQALPGIGRYTASAILSIAYGAPLPVLDGNVARVLARLHRNPAEFKTANGKETLWRLAGNFMGHQRRAASRSGDLNQALMELGATVCLPQQPRCSQCPLRNACLAYARGEVEKYPPPRQQRAAAARRFLAVLMEDREGRCLMVRRSPKANWLGGFWELPMWEQGQDENSPRLRLEKHLGTVRHTITDNKLAVAVYSASMRGRNIFPKGRWIAPGESGNFPITTISRKALALRDSGRNSTPGRRTKKDSIPSAGGDQKSAVIAVLA